MKPHILVPGSPGMGLFAQLHKDLSRPVCIDLDSYITQSHLFDSLMFVKDVDMLMCANYAGSVTRYEDILKACLDGRVVTIDGRPNTFVYTGRITLYINFPADDLHPALKDRFSIVNPEDTPKFLQII